MTSRPWTPPRPPALGLFFLGAALGAGILLPSACRFDDPFEGYYDPTVNFIASSGLEEGTIDRSAAGYQSSGVWTWSWRGADNADAFDYMTLINEGTVGTSAYPGLSSSSAVYRLTLVNLVADGDFNAASSEPASWAADSGASVAINNTVNRVHPGGTNYSLDIVTADQKGVRFDLETLLDYDAAAQHPYLWIFRTMNASTYHYQLSEYASFLGDRLGSAIGPLSNSEIVDQRITQFTTIGGATQQAVLFGARMPGSLTCDDIRVIRSDITPSFRLLLGATDTDPALANGYYEFSVWVRMPPGLTTVDDDDAAEPYASSAVSLKITNLKRLSGSNGAVYSATPTWTRLVLREEEGGNFTGIASTSAEQVMELSIYPGDFAAPDPGAVEIAQPELRFYLNTEGTSYFD